uniref:Uncharacterized protein n=1 Tax=Bicosoecida sp. CB-2014 TaxID=1486930 RepID=A0A7S1C9V5_9STRA|mmetsp:Transcript_18862/g.66656  ORF Transcript_18862/g.66656 Transcript_18862/m.66656 type:complete len:253 (+) Transcript_18862:374-1132(+)|eukprot:CAMPEP_0203832504 /NCGR_PEP_ID=MMETSP0115-20131106/70944_1 /ASSEMBLY_ACC=CAM_ASM_000227 /TAXON_ID=33651 /ORGANISM="Bicosoecid sp, Strain ms1" /LENGTH=252 /DNA_ID=CAMNT_0050741573 /DNA_START=324 /DNA_END=1082 /DNA_ORIENTATION=-
MEVPPPSAEGYGYGGGSGGAMMPPAYNAGYVPPVAPTKGNNEANKAPSAPPADDAAEWDSVVMAMSSGPSSAPPAPRGPVVRVERPPMLLPGGLRFEVPDWDTCKWVSWFIMAVIWAGAAFVALFFVTDATNIFKGYPVQLGCTSSEDMENNICIFSAGMISSGIVSFGMVSFGFINISQVGIGILFGFGQCHVNVGVVAAQVSVCVYAPFAQLSLSAYRVRFAQIGFSLLHPFLDPEGKLVVSCGGGSRRR